MKKKSAEKNSPAKRSADIRSPKHTTRGTYKPMPDSGLSDSGARAASVTGGMREPSNGVTRGRFDLIPPECLLAVSQAEEPYCFDRALGDLASYLIGACDGGAANFARYMLARAGSVAEGLRRLAIHYGKGAIKYTVFNPDGSVFVSGDRNWEKGLETGRTIDSLYRHLGQYQAGAQDEDHLAAVVWNTFAVMHHAPRIADGRYPRVLDTYGLVRS